MKKLVVMLAGLTFLFITEMATRAQSPAPPPGGGGPPGQLLTPDQLDQLAGPIALYPDPLIAEILPASTFPSEIVMASRYVSQGGDANLISQQGWDPSVQALAHYPNVLQWMDDNLAWTAQLGQAFENQQADVMDTIQRLRAKAQQLGNLPSTPQESVATYDGDIEIQPVNPDEMYVPVYQPDEIYYTPGYYCAFPYWLPLGFWLVHDWNWHNHGLILWGPRHPRPGNWWHDPPGQRHSFIASHPPPAWHPKAPAASVTARGGWQRGFEMPQAAPRVNIPRSAPAVRGPVVSNPAFRAPGAGAPVVREPGFREPAVRPPVATPAARAPEIRSAPSSGFFTGGATSHEAVESSSRGEASRAQIGGGGGAPSGGGGGGGGARHR